MIALISGSVEAAAAAKARWAFMLTVRCKGVLQAHRLSQLHLILSEARSRRGKGLWRQVCCEQIVFEKTLLGLDGLQALRDGSQPLEYILILRRLVS